MKPMRPQFREANRPPRWSWWLLAALAVTVVGVAIQGWLWKKQAQALNKDTEARIAASVAPLERSPPKRPAPAYAESAREMLKERDASWSHVLADLEQQAMAGVTPSGFEIIGNERSIRLEVTFNDYASLVRYVDRLNRNVTSARWALTSAQTSSQHTAPAASGIAVIVGRW